MTTQALPERPGSVTFRSKPMTLVGPELKKGAPAPDFSLVTKDLGALTLDDALAAGSKSALLIVVPSLDTPVCSRETQTFHQRLSELPASTVAYVVSVDLPFAQQRWAAASEAEHLTYLSDYREGRFGPAYGVLIKELGLLARAIFIIKPDRSVAYAAVCKDVSDEPNYDEVFAALGAA